MRVPAERQGRVLRQRELRLPQGGRLVRLEVQVPRLDDLRQRRKAQIVAPSRRRFEEAQAPVRARCRLPVPAPAPAPGGGERPPSRAGTRPELRARLYRAASRRPDHRLRLRPPPACARQYHHGEDDPKPARLAPSFGGQGQVLGGGSNLGGILAQMPSFAPVAAPRPPRHPPGPIDLTDEAEAAAPALPPQQAAGPILITCRSCGKRVPESNFQVHRARCR